MNMSLFNLNAELCANKVLNLKEVLLGFTISALLDEPDCVYPYAANYFEKKQIVPEVVEELEEEEREAELEEQREESSEESSEGTETTQTRQRNRSVFAERYNPELDEDEDDAAIPVYSKTPDERDLIYMAIRKCILFRSVDDMYMERIIDAMYPKLAKADEWIINQGEEGNHFYVIQEGTYEVWMTKNENSSPKLMKTYKDEGSFGELALMYNQPRAASVKAVTEGQLWVMDRHTFKKMVLKAIYKKRKLFEDLISKVSMLDELQPYERSTLADAMEEKRFQEGDVIIAQGDEADGMYFLIEGIVSVMIENPKTHLKEEITVLGEGDYFGELALVTQNPRAATVVAIEKAKTAFLDKDAFERILGPCLDVMARNQEAYKEQTAKIFGGDTPGRT